MGALYFHAVVMIGLLKHNISCDPCDKDMLIKVQVNYDMIS